MYCKRVSTFEIRLQVQVGCQRYNRCNINNKLGVFVGKGRNWETEGRKERDKSGKEAVTDATRRGKLSKKGKVMFKKGWRVTKREVMGGEKRDGC